MLPIYHRLKRAWAALWTNEPCSVASAAEITTILNRLRYAAKIKELPMALIDDINDLDTTIAAALAAKDAEAATNVAALAAANQTITQQSNELTASDAAILALKAKYAPPAATTSATGAGVVNDPATGLPVT